MMKLLFRFLIPLYILLLSGHTQVLAHTHEDAVTTCLENSEASSTHLSDVGYLLSTDDSILYPTPDIRKYYKVVLNDNEIEEDETISLKKSIEINNYFASHFYTQTPGYTATSLKNRLPLSKHFFYTSSCQRFIIFRVIRL